jgi:hypothetical protein
MLELAAGTYAVPHAGLNYVLASDLRLPAGSRLRLRGENPALRRRHRILYLSQDTELQRNTIRATLALMGRTAPRGLADMVAAWIEAADCRDVIILDEFDKYLNDAQVQTLGLHRFSWAVQVSHLERAGERHEFAHEFNLHFRREGAGKPGVFLEAEQLWPA